jgi:hypothetical protein
LTGSPVVLVAAALPVLAVLEAAVELLPQPVSATIESPSATHSIMEINRFMTVSPF